MKTPTLVCQEYNGVLKAWCPYCESMHTHKGVSGHRVAHCSADSGSPFISTGYILKIKPKKIPKKRKNTKSEHYVYFIKGGDFIKIGFAKSVETRLKELQTGCPWILKIIKSIKCVNKAAAMHLEKEYHDRFREKNVQNEWFFLKENDYA